MDNVELFLLPASDLPVGKKLNQPLCDTQKRVLLAAGTVITASVKEGLLLLGLKSVAVHEDDAIAWGLGKPMAEGKVSEDVIARTRETIASLGKKAAQTTQAAGTPIRDQLNPKGCASYDVAQHERLREFLAGSAAKIDQALLEGIESQLADLAPFDDATSTFAEELVEDMDNAISTTAYPDNDPQLHGRIVKFGMLSMAAAIEMGYDERCVKEIGLCALIHDFGMYAMDPKVRALNTPLNTKEQSHLASHPLLTLERLNDNTEIPPTVLLAASQVHENPNGSGYPLGIARDAIHPYAALLHVVDAYLSLITPHRGRRPCVPYDAMGYLLQQVNKGVIESDPLRSLLNAVSLFPVGSRVRLSDGSEAQVIRRNGSNYTQPIVQRVGAMRKFRLDAPHGSIIDLANTDLQLIAPLPSPEGQDTRIDESTIGRFLGDGPE